MIARLARALFGFANDRSLKRYQRRVPEINALEPDMQCLSDDQLRHKTQEFRERIANGEALDQILPEAFAVCREASWRVLGMRHFDVQLIGGMVLHDGRISEMRTGEGKTLVATLPVYLNALTGKGVHVVTVNDYLARRDATDLSVLYSFLGLTTGIIVPNLSDDERRAAYHSDITYGTNNEFGFDYLRDNMKYSLDEMVQRTFNYAIVDEVDSILIDEARTPLIISGPADDSSELYRHVDSVIARLVQEPDVYDKDEKFRTVTLTEAGSDRAEELLREANILTEGGLYDVPNVAIVHHVQQSLRAHTLFARDVDYMVRGGKLILVDEFTGRMMDGRRYSDGLHQALEAKEHVEIQQENQTLASITFQNYFRLYPKLSGMTGTAMTEADEFAEIYNLEVVEIPTNVPVQRMDADDEVYLTAVEKYNAVANLIEEIRAKQQPVLVGTASIEKSEYLSNILTKRRISHNVLNARQHEREAMIIAQAGAPSAITIATNMAGRGTDIKLGGNVEMLVEERLSTLSEDDVAGREAAEAEIRAQVERDHDIVRDAGGLYVVGTERHESRRVDNQLRGRAGRQGDPGNSRFFLSLEDDLIRIFGTDRMGGMMQKMGLKEGEAIIHPWLNRALEKAQKKVEARNFDMRKNTLKYDDVMNDQRREVYAQRREYMGAEDVSSVIQELRMTVIDDIVQTHIPQNSFVEAWDIEGLQKEAKTTLGLDLPLEDWAQEDGMDDEGMAERIEAEAIKAHAAKTATMGPDMMRMVEKHVLLTSLDASWKEHLHALDQMRQGIGLRAYGQRDPLNEYKHEAFQMFSAMLFDERLRVVQTLSHVQTTSESPSDILEETPLPEGVPNIPANTNDDVDAETLARWNAQVSRNALCPCGSGRKFKHCHGKLV